MATEGIIKESLFYNVFNSSITLCFAKSHGILDSLILIKKFYLLNFRFRNFTNVGTNKVVTCKGAENGHYVFFGCLEVVIDT